MMRWLLSPLLFLPFRAFAADDALAVRGQDSYAQTFQPVLEKYCFDCHSDGVKKGKFALDEHKDYAALRADLKHWDHVRQMLATHVMPPSDKDAPTLEERDALVKWIDDNIFWWPADQPDPGHVVIRRLNRSQYNNTIRDVFSLNDLKPADEFPPDDTGYGYDNIGAVLSVSPMLMEKYLRAAQKVTTAALRVTAPEKASIMLGAAKFDRKAKGVAFEDDGVLWFESNASSKIDFDAPAEGTYRIVLRVAATQVTGHTARIEAKLDGKTLGEHEVTGVWHEKDTKWQRLEIETAMKQGGHSLSIAFVNDFYDPALPEKARDLNVALDEAMIEGPIGLTAPRPSKFLRQLAPNLSFGAPSLELSGEDFLPGEGPSGRDTGSSYLASTGHVRHPLEITVAGKHRFKLKLGALQAGNEPAKWEARLGDRVIQSGAVTAKDQNPQWFEFNADVPVGRYDLRIAFLNDFYDEKTKADRNLWVHEVKIEGPSANTATLAEKDLPALIEKIGTKLFRRPMSDPEKAQWGGLATLAVAQGEPPLGAFGYALEGMLASPAFLFHSQPKPAGARIGQSELIDEVTLASRLSYFLWSGPPDDALLQLALKGELRKNLEREVRRMIADWRSGAFTESFAGQWLLLRDADLVQPSRRLFPDFEGGIAYAMKHETEMLFDHILHENRSVIEFLNADYTFVNRKLATYYKLPGADKLKTKDKNAFVKVSLTGTPRGGLLTQGSILSITSNPTRTNIVRRGKFILENVLGMPPPPAPGGVPPLDEEKARFGNLTLRQQFEQHREDQSCAGCHALLDPIGFAMENYDAVGRFRESDHKQPIDATGKLIRGQPFKDLVDLRDILVRDMKPDFIRCLVENLMTFSLGRGLDYADRPAVRDTAKRCENADYKFQDLILAVCQSVPFQRMRVDQ